MRKTYVISCKHLNYNDGFFSRFVANSLDDHEGERTMDAITNFHGIVKFEMAKVFTLSENPPISGWSVITPIAESISFPEKLENGKTP